MAPVLVTGASGFVGARLTARLAARGVEVVGLSRRGPGSAVDVTDADAVRRAIEGLAPERVFHLAALAHPGACERDPERADRVNAGGTRHVLAALAGSGARVLLASTAHVYGPSPPVPVGEGAADRARDLSAYGRSKRAAERAAEDAAAEGLDVVIARPFNHSGRGQEPEYVLPAFAEAVRRAARDGGPVRVGNLWPRRDFLHVDDVLDAYELLIERGERGEPYNVCRGEGTSIGELLDGLVARAAAEVEIEIDPARVRAGETREVVGDPSKLAALGWEPRVSIEALLDELAEGWAKGGRLAPSDTGEP